MSDCCALQGVRRFARKQAAPSAGKIVCPTILCQNTDFADHKQKQRLTLGAALCRPNSRALSQAKPKIMALARAGEPCATSCARSPPLAAKLVRIKMQISSSSQSASPRWHQCGSGS